MTPLTDDEKRQITRFFQALKAAIIASDPDLPQKYRAFQTAYRGDSRAYVDEFDHLTDKTQWVSRLEMYLMDEIEASFWHLPIDDGQDAGRAWIRQRLEEIANALGVKIDGIEFADNPKALGEILIVRANSARVAADVGFTTLEDLASDDGKQAKMDARLRDLISRIPRVGDRVVFERVDGLFEVENVVASGKPETIDRTFKTRDEAWQIARGHLEKGRRVLSRHHATPNSFESFGR
jgi:hypothetical protein